MISIRTKLDSNPPRATDEPMHDDSNPAAAAALKEALRREAQRLGFEHFGVAGVSVHDDAAHLARWIDAGLHGTMSWMERNHDKRTAPDALVPGTLSVVSVGLDYGRDPDAAWENLRDSERAYVARYALGRDYHKLMRNRLQQLADWLTTQIGPMGYRVFVDSAPVLERALARNAGLGWIGKHTCLIDSDGGSWFFLGELFVDAPLPPDPPATAHCGTCVRCIEICPTQAIIAPWKLDARRCISYLTIEHEGAIAEEFREAIGNRIFGCDDCQLVCPWNKFAKRSDEPDFRVRNNLDQASLVDLFNWTEDEFLARTEGSAIRRSGYRRWRRNIAVALGNAESSPEVLATLSQAKDDLDLLVQEHVVWAIAQHARRASAGLITLVE